MTHEALKSQQLQKFSAEVHQLENDLTSCEQGVRTSATAWASIAIDMGHALERVKNTVGHGHFREWVENNYRRSYRHAAVCQQMAKAYDAATDVQRSALLENGSIQGFLDALKEQSESKGEAAKSTPTWLSIVNGIGRLKDKCLNSFDAIPPEGLDKIRSDFKPLAAKLWPELF